jgi:arabinose-5-phosphate isomerase
VILDAARKVLQIEADSVREQIRNLGPDFESAVEEISASNGRLCVTGLGKSGLIGQKIAATLSSTGTPAYFLHAAEASHGDLGMLVPGDTVLALSFSGETPEVVRLLEFARERNVRAIAMTGEPASSVGRAADRVMAISEKRGFREEDFAALHPGGRLGRKFLKVKDLMRTGDRIPLVTRDTPMTEAIHEMSRKMMGVTAVVNGRGELAGVISDGDLRRLLEKDPSLLARTAGECSHARPKTIAGDGLASEALERMQEAKITSLFVVDGAGGLTGAIHMHDLLAAGIA